MKKLTILISILAFLALAPSRPIVLVDPETGEAEIYFEVDEDICVGESGAFIKIDEGLWANGEKEVWDEQEQDLLLQ